MAVICLTCGDGGKRSQMLFDVSLDLYCRMNDVDRIEIYLLKQHGLSSWCLLTDGVPSIEPIGERSFDAIDLESGSTVRVVALGLAGGQCVCIYDDVFPVEDGSEFQIELDRPSSFDATCKAPEVAGSCS